jgi:hypothetical protein
VSPAPNAFGAAGFGTRSAVALPEWGRLVLTDFPMKHAASALATALTASKSKRLFRTKSVVYHFKPMILQISQQKHTI